MRVYGGMTHAGWKKQKPAAGAWFCGCRNDGHKVLRPGYLVRCTDCKEKRP